MNIKSLKKKDEHSWGSINIAIQPNVRRHKYRKIRNIIYIKRFSVLFIKSITWLLYPTQFFNNI